MSDIILEHLGYSLIEAKEAYKKGEVPIGAVIVCENQIIARGHNLTETLNDVTAHAEMQAITSAANFLGGKYLLNCTLYVTIEPCQMCARVIIGTSDPNPKVSGLGIQKLKNNNINVKVGVLEDECDKLNKRFFCYHKNKRPYIILKWAKSSDNFIAPHNQNEPFWMTSNDSKKLVHQWRSEEDAILVGRITIYKDNPELTTRYWNGKSPTPIIIDPNNRIKPNSKVLKKHNKIYHFIDKKIKINNKHSIHINFKKSIHELLNNLEK